MFRDLFYENRGRHIYIERVIYIFNVLLYIYLYIVTYIYIHIKPSAIKIYMEENKNKKVNTILVINSC